MNEQLKSLGNLGVVAFAFFGFGINALLGSKTNLLSVLLALLVVRHYLVKPIKPLPALVLAVGGVVLALGFDLYFREFLVIRQISSINQIGRAHV